MAKKPFSINRVRSGFTVFNVMALGEETYIESSLVLSKSIPLYIDEGDKPEAFFGLTPIPPKKKNLKGDFPELSRAFFFYENDEESKANCCYHRSFFSRKKAESYKNLCIKLGMDSTCTDDFYCS